MIQRNREIAVRVLQGGGFGSGKVFRGDIGGGERQAQELVPVARMLHEHIFPKLGENMPSRAIGVFIGPEASALLEANAFRLACIANGITPERVFLLEQDGDALRSGALPSRRAQMAALLNGSPETSGVVGEIVELEDSSVGLFSSGSFIDAVQKRQPLPDIVCIESAGGNKRVVEAIMQASSQDSSLLAIGRNVSAGLDSYGYDVTEWGRQVAQRNARGKSSLLAFTADNEGYGRSLYNDIKRSLTDPNFGLYTREGISPDNLTLLTRREGYDDRYPSAVEESRSLGEQIPRVNVINYGDEYLYVLGRKPA